MATATFKLFRLKVSDLVATVREIIAKLTANAVVYATPNPTIATLTSQSDALDLSYQKAIDRDKTKKKQMRLDREKLLQSMSQLQAYVQITSGGDASKINLVASVKKQRSPAGIKPPPANVRSFFGYVAGEIRLLYGGVGGRIYYRVQINPRPTDPAAWTDYVQTTKTRVLVSGLVSGSEYALRVSTVTADGMGSWSDPILQKAL